MWSRRNGFFGKNWLDKRLYFAVIFTNGLTSSPIAKFELRKLIFSSSVKVFIEMKDHSLFEELKDKLVSNGFGCGFFKSPPKQ